MSSLRRQALQWLLCADADAKARGVRGIDMQAEAGAGEAIAEPAGIPGRPARPALVAHTQLRTRSVHTVPGRAALLHALAHIELNAIDLALDAVWRFAGLPDDFYRQWLQVAREEALHFELLRGHLATLGHAYGDFDAHDGLWQMARSTADDLVARMALVPRTLEARGLDATPPMQERLRKVGTPEALSFRAALDVILREMRAAGFAGTELGHAYPRTTEALGAALRRHDLQLVGRRLDGRDVEACGGQLRGEPGGVGVDDLATGELGADREDGGLHRRDRRPYEAAAPGVKGEPRELHALARRTRRWRRRRGRPPRWRGGPGARAAR